MKTTVLITGATGGIGSAISNIFAMNGYDTVLVATDNKKLSTLSDQLTIQYSNNNYVIVADLTNKDAANGVYSEISSLKIHISILVNNAGVGLNRDFSDMSWHEVEEMLNVNIISLTNLTRLFLPGMIKLKHGYILNVASTGAYQPGPGMAVYFATKHYVLAFSEALYQELSSKGIIVTALCPGPTITGFVNRANVTDSKLYKNNLLNVNPDQIAIKAYEAMMKKKRVVIPGLFNKLLVIMSHIIPNKLIMKYLRANLS